MRRSYLLLFAVLLWQLNATGQTASERRAQKEKESKANVLFQDNDAIFNVRKFLLSLKKNLWCSWHRKLVLNMVPKKP